MLFAVGTPSVLAARIHLRLDRHAFGVGCVVPLNRLPHDIKQPQTFDFGRRTVKITVHKLAVKADSFKDAGSAVAHDRADAHLSHYFGESLADGLDVMRHRIFGRKPCQGSRLADQCQTQIRMHSFGAVPQKQRKVMRLENRPRVHDQPRIGAQSFPDEMLMQRA